MGTILRSILAVFSLMLVAQSSAAGKEQLIYGMGRNVLSEERLINNLMESYVKEARPVLKHNDAVSVSVKFSFVRVEDLEEATDTFTSSLFIVQMWNDPRLRWNMSEYDGIQTVRLPASKLWIPDLVLYNVAYKTPPQSLYEQTVTVTRDGNVVWIPMLTLYSTCPMDLTDFPYDVQTCNLVFGSWMHTSWEMNITFISNDTSEMDIVLNDGDTSYPVHQHPQWELVDNKARAKLTVKKYDCCQQPFTLITVSVKLRRKPQFYHHLTVGPAALIGFLVPFIYLVPARSQDKTVFGLLLLLSMMVLMTILQQAIPFSHGSLPRICTFYLGTVVLICASIFMSVIIANITIRGVRRRPVPAWVFAVFLGKRSLRRLVCIGEYRPVENLYGSELHSASASEVGLQEIEEGLSCQLLQNPEGSLTERHMAQTARYVKFIVGKMAADITYKNINQDWEELGRVIDRCLFIVFFLLYVYTAPSSLL